MRKFLISGVLIGMHIVLFAFTPPKISFDHFGVEDGFYGKSVTVMLQDSRDFLWIGTREGLYRYNGYTFEVFQHNSTDSTCISSNVISSIAEDRDGNIWVGTIKGINLFNRAGNNFLRDFSQFDNAGALLQTQNVRKLFVDRLNNIWAGTDRSEVFVLKKRKKSNNANNGFDQSIPSFDTSLTNGWTAFRVSHADLIRNQRTIVFISQDDIGDVWVGGMHAFYIINPENLDIKRKILFEDGDGYVIQNGITRICKIDEGLFWLGSINGGLYKFNISTNKITPYYLRKWGNDSKSIDLITSIYEDDKGNLWIGTRDKGLFFYDPETDHFYDYYSDPSNAKSLSNNTILSVLRDKFDLMWVGTWNGLNRGIFENKRFLNIKALPTSRQKAEVKGFYFDKHGKIWMATDHGLNILNPDFTLFRRFIYKPYDDKGISHFVTCDIKIGPGNRIYLATFGGIDIFDEGMNIVGHIRQTDYPNKSLGDNYVFDMTIDGDTLWAGTMNGLSRINLNTGTVKNYFSEEYEGRESSFLNSTIIYALERDSAGNIWAGGNKGLLVILKKNGRTVRYLHDIHDPGSISNNSIRDVFTDSKGNVWAGTANGLNKWLPDQKKFIKYITDEIPNIEVTSINEDKTGKLWLGTKMNLLRFNPQNGEVIRYHEHDGINSCKFIQHAVSSDESGRLYFGTSDGMIMFYPDLIRNDTIGTKVYITDFKILNKSIRAGEIVNGRMILNESIEMCDTIHVFPEDYIISFEWAALYFTTPKYIKYRYRLENFEKEWKEVDAAHRYASYSNLPGGQYTFRVVASNHDGIWNEEGADIILIVHPHIWETTWFRMMIFLLAVLLFIIYGRYRSYKIRQRNKRLEEEVTKRTRLIEEQKREMGFQYKKIEKQKNELLKKAEKLNNVQLELKKTNVKLKDLNESLERLVDDRTKELKSTIERLEKTDRELNTFLYHASHDLRGPLTTLLGLSSFSEIDHADSRIKQYFVKIRDTTNQLMRTLRKLSDINLFFNGDYQITDVDVGQLYNSIARELDKMDPDRVVRREVDIRIRGPITSNSTFLKIIVLYVMENSILFRKEEVEDPWVHLQINKDDRKLVIRVEDNGSGIPPEIVSKVFNMFYRGSEKSKGNGLGLYLVEKAVNALGGTCRIASEPNEYFVFESEIPLEGLD